MNPMEALIQELDHEAATTRHVLECVPEAAYAWRPHEKGMSMGELCGHIASLPGSMPQVLGAEGFDVSQRPGPEAAPATTSETIARFDESVSAAREWLTGLGERAGETWRVYQGEDEIMAMPRAAAIRFFMFNHLYHHRGQLSAYLRAAGEVVPSVYGPTADVDPFAS